MTNEEAKTKFKDILMAEIERIPTHYDAEVDVDIYDDTARIEEILELNKIVCDALEKQIPKKPIYGAANTRCPNCGEVLLYYSSVCKICYCDECWQRLDWSEENNE